MTARARFASGEARLRRSLLRLRRSLLRLRRSSPPATLSRGGYVRKSCIPPAKPPCLDRAFIAYRKTSLILRIEHQPCWIAQSDQTECLQACQSRATYFRRSNHLQTASRIPWIEWDRCAKRQASSRATSCESSARRRQGRRASNVKTSSGNQKLVCVFVTGTSVQIRK